MTSIKGTFLIRSGSLEQWNDTSKPDTGANRVLLKGEIGWVINTSDFKIGDGVRKWSELSYIQPGGGGGTIEYAYKLGDVNGYYTYNELKSIIDSLPDFDNMEIRIENLETKVAELETYKNKYYDTFSDLPAIGVQGPLYVIKSTGDVYFFNVDEIEGGQLGYVKINNFDIIQSKLN